MDTSDKSKHGGTWLPGAVLNIADCCIQPSIHPRKEDNGAAIVWREESDDDSSRVKSMTLQELRAQVMYAHILCHFNSTVEMFSVHNGGRSCYGLSLSDTSK